MIPFSKYEAAGNDFIMVDGRGNSLIDFFMRHRSVVSQMCERKMGIGADGLIILLDSKIAHFKMVIFNCDGTIASMCGNGLRCLALYTQSPTCNIETDAGIMQCEVMEGVVKIEMQTPIQRDIPKELVKELQEYEPLWFFSGTEHLVLWVDKTEGFPLDELGSDLRHHAAFAPIGVNVNIVSRKTLQMRTYEKGVEGETAACGTGAAAVFAAAKALAKCKSSLNLKTLLGHTLSLATTNSGVSLIGPARHVYCGTYVGP